MRIISSNRIFMHPGPFRAVLVSFTILALVFSIPSIRLDFPAARACGDFRIDVLSADPDLESAIVSESRGSGSGTVRIISGAGSDLVITQGADVWADQSVLDDGTVREKLIRSYSEGRRVVILGEGQSRKGILEYFREDTTDMTDVIEEPREAPAEKDSRMIARKLIGMMVYKKNGVVDTTSIYSDEDIGEIYKLLLYVTTYDYVGLAAGSQDKSRSMICPAEVSAEPANSWNSVKVSTRTDSCTRFIMNMSLKIDKNAGNPNNAGQYLYYSVFRTDIHVKLYSGSDPMVSGYSISKSEIRNIGKTGAALYDYSPHNRNSSAANVSISLPWGISASFDPETRIKITKTSGGIDSNNVGIEYKVVNWLGFQAYEYESMWCEVHYEAFQTSSFFQTTGDYLITTFEMNSYDGSPANGIHFYPGIVFTIGGT